MTTDKRSTATGETLTEGEREALCICAELASVNLSADDEYIERACSNHVATAEQIVVACMARAWDEGHRFTGYEPGCGENPYRGSPARKPSGAGPYLDVLESMNPSLKIQAVIDRMRANMGDPSELDARR